jgi:hypothetical protein
LSIPRNHSKTVGARHELVTLLGSVGDDDADPAALKSAIRKLHETNQGRLDS